MPTWLPLAAFLGSMGLAVVWRVLYQRARYGHFGVILFRGGPAQTARDLSLVLLAAGYVGEAAIHAVRPGLFDPLTVPLPIGDHARWILGLVVVAVSTALLLVSQLQLGASWRIGIEEGARPGLVTGGFYRWVRNPIFTAMLGTMIGYAILLPTWISLAIVAVSWILVRAQTLGEEAYLLRTYGDEYRIYAARVGRFVPGIGRLAKPVP